MNLYLVKQRLIKGYDTYDSFVVAAEDKEEARTTHPAKLLRNVPVSDWPEYAGWPRDLDDIEVIFLGKADSNIQAGVICSSFYAG